MERLTLVNVSKHLTNDVIDKVYKFKTDSDDSIKNVKVSRAAPAGEGLISAVYRITVNGLKYQGSFIVKGLVDDILLRKTLNCVDFFKREAIFFCKILPVMIETQKSLGGKERIQSIVPVCYGCHIDGIDDFILMEDLSQREFKSISTTPTLLERNMILKVLAHFHSVSLAMRLTKSDVFTRITDGLNELYYNDANRVWYSKYLQKALRIDKDVLMEMEGTDSIYYKKFTELMDEDIYGLLNRISSTRGDHPVVNHGDAWCPNFLCCKDKAVTIDFQLLRCASPATDLSYFIMLCSNLCQNKEDFFEAVEIYYRSLTFYLKDMGFDANKVFPLYTLKEELQKYGKFGLFAALTSIPLMASERCDTLQSFETKYTGFDRIPLEELWKLSPIKTEEHKLQLVNAVRVAVDVNLI